MGGQLPLNTPFISTLPNLAIIQGSGELSRLIIISWAFCPVCALGRIDLLKAKMLLRIKLFFIINS